MTEAVTPPPPSAASESGLTVAAVDLGSNSFHMVIGRWTGIDLIVVDKIKEPVRLAEGLRRDGTIDESVQQRALDCLQRFGQRLQGLPPGCVRAVGTNTLRRASEQEQFRERAVETLGHPIEVISGQEEARLIYQGIHHAQPFAGQRLALDIGGGSTELMVARGADLLRAHSLFMGCVSYTKRYFPEGEIDRDCFRLAETAVALELRGIRQQLRSYGWEAAIGSSGTVNAVAELLRLNDLGGPGITLPRLKQLRRLLIERGSISELDFEGLRPYRATVLPGGLAILIGVMRNLEVDEMTPSSGALREGVLWDLLGRIHHDDVRDRAIRAFVDRYHVDVAQAARVERTTNQLLDTLELTEEDREAARSLLSWAAWLHEIGLVVSYTGYQKHGAYLVRHTDLPGFSKDDQAMLAVTVGGHRRKLTSAWADEIPAGRRKEALMLTIVLRLAVLLHRSRSSDRLPTFRLERSGSDYTLRVPADWFEAHPLTRVDLERENRYLGGAGLKLKLEVAG